MSSVVVAKKFLAIGNTITKYTNPIEKKLEEFEIGATIPFEETAKEKVDCQVLETTPCHRIATEETLPIRFFQDGIQRTQFLGNLFSEKLKRLVPLVFSTVGGIIVEIREGLVRKYLEPIMNEKFIIPKLEYLPKEIPDVIPPEYRYEVTDFDYTLSDYEFRRYIFQNLIRKLRIEVETAIIKQFNETTPNEWLVIDGYVIEADPHDRKVGVIKRHSKEWLKPELKFEMLKEFMKLQGQKARSCLFKISHATGPYPELVSCYTKLLYNFRGPVTVNPEFSLIRVETPFQHKDSFDKILNTILGYNRPYSNPSDQWDKKLYPILVAEKMLKSYAKDERLISAAFRRM